MEGGLRKGTSTSKPTSPNRKEKLKHEKLCKYDTILEKNQQGALRYERQTDCDASETLGNAGRF